MTRTGWYLYAITQSPSGIDLEKLEGLPTAGGTPRPVELVAVGSVAALVSPLPEGKVRAQRVNLAAHNVLLRKLLESGVPFLPAAFGVVAPARKELEQLLIANRSDLEKELRRLAGKVEMGLKVHWDVDNIFAFFVSQYPELATLRDRLMAKPGGASRDEMIELGQEFEGLLKHARERHTASIRRSLGPCVMDFVQSDPRTEKEVVRLSCLTSGVDVKEFERLVLQAAAAFDEHYVFDYNGPWPPFSFVSVSLKSAMTAGDKNRG